MRINREGSEPGRRLLLLVGAALGAGVAVAKSAAAADPATKLDQADIAEIVKDWSPASKAAADDMQRKYGPPQEAAATLLIWHSNGPWKRTVVQKTEVEHDFPVKHADVLEQVVEYKVPLNFFGALATYNGSVVADRTRGELSAHCESEAMNILALNLAHDIVRGARSAEEARAFHAAVMRDLQAGKQPDYAQRLLLGAPQGDLADPDTPALLPASGSSQP
jgi:hypothetical protein